MQLAAASTGWHWHLTVVCQAKFVVRTARTLVSSCDSAILAGLRFVMSKNRLNLDAARRLPDLVVRVGSAIMPDQQQLLGQSMAL